MAQAEEAEEAAIIVAAEASQELAELTSRGADKAESDLAVAEAELLTIRSIGTPQEITQAEEALAFAQETLDEAEEAKTEAILEAAKATARSSSISQ